jgi:hypothetical protein
MSLLARSLPYRVVDPKTNQCQRCGITRESRSPYCRDCKPYAPKADK